MKKFKALTASILASAMVMSMTAGFATFAAEGEETTPTTSNDIQKVEVKDGETTKVTYIISVQQSDAEKGKKETVNHKYEAYQIFTAQMVTDSNAEETEGTESKEKFNVTGWGSGITNPKDLIDELQKTEKFVVGNANIFAGITVDANNDVSASKVAEVLTNAETDEEKIFQYDNEYIQAFAKIVGKYLDSTKAVKAEKPADSAALTDIEVDSAGYYLIKDTEGSPTVGDSKYEAGKTRYILTPTDTINPTAKADYPTIDKNIVEGDNLVDYNTAAIGDTIVYQLDSKVPDMTGYNKYYYIVNDTMCEGLTFDYKEKNVSETVNEGEETETTVSLKSGEGVSVVITPANGGKEITLENQAPNEYDKDTDQEFYVETTDNNGKTEVKIVIKNFIQYEKGSDIKITYNAILNENANIGTTGNPNVVDLTFSNDPNFDYGGDKTPGNPPPENPDEPGPKEPTGVTPKFEVITYTTGIEITKVDANNKEKTLKGAEFMIQGESLTKVLIKDAEVFEEATDGTYYLLADGKYTETAPDDADENTKKYKKVQKIVAFTEEDDSKVMKELKVDDDGSLKIYGLNEGTYTITETKAPEGYIIKDKSKKVTISALRNAGEMVIENKKCTWNYELTGVEKVDSNVRESDGILEFKITNPKGVTLPGTGAFGTKLIYALGTLFTGTGAAYMVSKKKSKKD
ncbi:MAG: isopeptide-forming domain-containing fimbrial protein [Ruminococcus sp.]|nr:isopeptide-forming domain-containing fimbrial protein [Ruminococcus sp.]